MNLGDGPLSRLSWSLDRDKLLAELVLLKGLVPESALDDCLTEARKDGPGSLGRILAARGLLTPAVLSELERELDLIERDPVAGELASAPGARRIGHYRLLEVLGEGGAGVVFRARDETLGREVALKILKTAQAYSPQSVERFQQECRNAARLRHPGIVTVHEAGREGEVLYCAMELVFGRPFAPSEGDLAGRVKVLEKVARAVQYAHEQGIIHRDLKPLNILLDAQGEPRLLDFGLSRNLEAPAGLTRSGTALGTPLYMAPEQAAGKTADITVRTDVYALGAILYEVLAGRPPHVGESITELYGKILGEDPVPPRRLNPKAPAGLEAVALKALDKDPSRRYASAGEYAEDLARHLAGEPVLARSEGPLARVGRRIRKRLALYALAGAVAAALLGAGVIALGGREKGRRLEVEREAALRALRDQARLSLDAALRLRRNGDTEGMRRFLPPLESAYQEALRRAPGLAEVEYLMGRMYRALMEDEKALECQRRALSHDANHSPALYERVVLLSKKYARELRKFLESEGLPRAEGGEEPAAERLSAELVRMRERILEDSLTLGRCLEAHALRGDLSPVSHSNLLAARGIFAAHSGRTAAAVELLEDAVAENPLLEEAWESLAQSASVQAGEAAQGEEKEARWAFAERAYGEGIRLDRGYVPHWVGRGHVRTERAVWRRNRGKDPEPDYAAAVEDFGQAIRLDAGYAEAWMRRGRVFSQRAHLKANRGEDPLEVYAEAERDLTEAVRLDPAYGEAWMRRARMRHGRGTFLTARGAAGRPDLAASEADFSRAIELGVVTAEILGQRGQSRRSLAQVDRSRGDRNGAREWYLKAIADFEKSVGMDPSRERSTRPSLEDCRQKVAELR
jgi:tetratricopeptide (TPR) repeat protein